MIPFLVSSGGATASSAESANFEEESTVILEPDPNVSETVLDSEGGIANQSDGVGINAGPFHAPIPLALRYAYR